VGVLSLAELRPGMVLEQSLFTGGGVMLLPCGTRLADKHLALLKHWQVREAQVEGAGRDKPTGDPEADLDPELLAMIDRALDEKFALDDEDEIIRELKRIVRTMTLHEAVRRVQTGGPGHDTDLT